MFKQRLFTLMGMIALLLLSLTASAGLAQETVITLITHDSFNISEDVLAEFEAEQGVRVELFLVGDAGSLVNQAVLTRNNPLGDVLFGVDNTFLSRALGGDIFIPYESPLLAEIPEAFQVDPENRVTPISYGDVCLNYDVAYFAENDLALPESLSDLTDPAYRGLLVTQNPATSSPGLAFLMATIAAFGEEGDYTYLDYWRDLVANDVLIVEDWTSAYYGAFTVSGGGDRPMVVSYASSPPVEVIFANPPVTEAPTGSIIADEMCFRQIEFAGILRGTPHEAEAQALIDFMLSETFQEDVPLQMFVFPVNPNAELPAEFIEYVAIPENPASLDSETIDANRDNWIEAWTEAVLR